MKEMGCRPALNAWIQPVVRWWRTSDLLPSRWTWRNTWAHSLCESLINVILPPKSRGGRWHKWDHCLSWFPQGMITSHCLIGTGEVEELLCAPSSSKFKSLVRLVCKLSYSCIDIHRYFPHDILTWLSHMSQLFWFFKVYIYHCYKIYI